MLTIDSTLKGVILVLLLFSVSSLPFCVPLWKALKEDEHSTAANVQAVKHHSSELPSKELWLLLDSSSKHYVLLQIAPLQDGTE